MICETFSISILPILLSFTFLKQTSIRNRFFVFLFHFQIILQRPYKMFDASQRNVKKLHQFFDRSGNEVQCINSFHPQSQYKKNIVLQTFFMWFCSIKRILSRPRRDLDSLWWIAKCYEKKAILKWELVIVSFWNTLAITLFYTRGILNVLKAISHLIKFFESLTL